MRGPHKHFGSCFSRDMQQRNTPSSFLILPYRFGLRCFCCFCTMAAIICDAIGQFCKGIGHVCGLPCKLCAGCCLVSGKACKLVCGCQSPFTPFVLTSVALHVPSLVFAVRTIVDAPGCGFLSTWIYVYALLSVVHIVGSFYIAFRMGQDYGNDGDTTNNSTPPTDARSSSRTADESPWEGKSIWEIIQDMLTPGREDPATRRQSRRTAPSSSSSSAQRHRHGDANTWKRLRHMLCYDVGVALYMILWVFWLVWLSIGSPTIYTHNNDDDADCEDLEGWARWAVICGYTYLAVVVFAFACSFVFLKC
jgi:hypothetical protein